MLARRNYQKRRNYAVQFERALATGEVKYGFSLECFKCKQELRALRDGSRDVMLSIYKVDDLMTKLGFLKGDVVEAIFDGKRDNRHMYMVFVRMGAGEFEQAKRELPRMLTESGNDEISFVINRKGKQMSISVPKFNKDQLETFKEKFEKQWDEMNPIENFMK